MIPIADQFADIRQHQDRIRWEALGHIWSVIGESARCIRCSIFSTMPSAADRCPGYDLHLQEIIDNVRALQAQDAKQTNQTS